MYKVSLKTTLELSINKESGSSLYAVCEMRAASSSQTEIASTPFFLSLLFCLLNFPKSNKSWQPLKEEQKRVDRVGL